MRKLIIASIMTVGLLATAVEPAQAQLLKFGLKFGLNMTEVEYDGMNRDNEDDGTGFFFGPQMDVKIPFAGLGADVSLLLSQRGSGDWKQTGLEVPINLKYNISILPKLLGVYVAAGPDFYMSLKELEKNGYDKKLLQVGINVGGGVKVINHLVLGYTYQFALNRQFTGSNGAARGDTWQLSLAWMF